MLASYNSKSFERKKDWHRYTISRLTYMDMHTKLLYRVTKVKKVRPVEQEEEKRRAGDGKYEREEGSKRLKERCEEDVTRARKEEKQMRS